MINRWFHMSPFERSNQPIYLTARVLAKASQMFDEAERATANDPERLLRVQVARLSLDYVKLHVASRLESLVSVEEKKLPIDDWYRGAMEQFFATAQRGGVGHIRESSRSRSTMEEFKRLLTTLR